jgi:phosphatidylglycerophosphatase A
LSPLFFTPLTPWIRGLILLLVVGLGIHASARAIAAFNAKDPEAVIIDEFAGQLLVFLLVRDPGASTIAAGLVLFRLFDILKPWPVGASESWFTEGVGVMADDLLAGAYALLVLHLVLTLV